MNDEILKKVHNANKNLIISGNISTGKTKNIGFPLMKKIIESNESFFVLDSKEEYLNKYYKLVNEKGYNVIIINLRDSNKSEGWNILDYPYSLYKDGNIDEALNCVEQIGKELFYEGKNVDPYWGNSAASLFSGFVFYLFQDARKEEINLSSVYELLNSVDGNSGFNYYKLLEYIENKGKNNIAYKCISSPIYAPKETRESINSVAKQKISDFVKRESLNILLSKTTFDIEDIINKKTAIFLIGKDEETSLNSIISVFINQLYSLLINNKRENRFNFILDNFDTLNNIYSLKDVMSSCIARNIKFIISTRSKENIEEQYGNYINKLSNELEITDKETSILNNNEETIFENNFEYNEFEKKEIHYPMLQKQEIATFNYKNILKQNTTVNIENIGEEGTKKSLDDWLVIIDKKIEEIESQIINDNKKGNDKNE